MDVDPRRGADNVQTGLRSPNANMSGSDMIPTKRTSGNRTPWKDDPPWTGRAVFHRIRTHEREADRLPYRILNGSAFCVSHRCIDLRDWEEAGDPNAVFGKNLVHSWIFRNNCAKWSVRNGKPCDPDGEFVYMVLFGYHCPDYQIDNEARIVIFKDEAGMRAAVGEAVVHEVMES